MSDAAWRSSSLPELSGPGDRVRAGYLAWLDERLSDRDWAIIEIVNRLRLVRGDQVQRLYFFGLSGRSGEVTRGRVLHRLVEWRLLDVLSRRIGGGRRGSSGSIFALGLAGQQLLARRQAMSGLSRRVRHVGVPTDRLIRHTLTVSELYVSLTEQARSQEGELVTFEAEPACWWPNGLGGQLKPDSYLLLASGAVRDHWWVEVDRATESLPTLRRKLQGYLDFVHRGQLGPEGLVPRVLVSVPDARRRDSLRSICGRLPDPAQQLFHIAIENDAAPYLLELLRQ